MSPLSSGSAAATTVARAATVLIDVAVGEPVVSPGYLHVPDETAMRIHWRHRNRSERRPAY